jgi:hypothetical protein
MRTIWARVDDDGRFTGFYPEDLFPPEKRPPDCIALSEAEHQDWLESPETRRWDHVGERMVVVTAPREPSEEAEARERDLARAALREAMIEAMLDGWIGELAADPAKRAQLPERARDALAKLQKMGD